ncbi:IclR family transcriptional regulator [Microbacterium sp. M28]|uniref:IclR family transcriptional regulator n=1 Tax=Microbacterium sp. M28 TaxID=2962064 RepID=UPI0021F4A83D|nr:IclR family transcriptional regulator [Microbacterium sp. M28]UYO96488.1 IclR family transcriptional regulator [Microbacterium sp. M28]
MSTLANARDVLRLLARRRRSLTVTEVAAELGQPKSSVSRTLGLMAEFGFLQRDPVTLAYGPGELVAAAAYRNRPAGSVVSLLGDALADLVHETGCTGYLNVLDGANTLVIQMRTSPSNPLQAYTPEGTRAPAYSTSMGRALLARLEDEAVTALIDGRFDEAVGSAPRDDAQLLESLAVVRAQGWALSSGEIVPNVAGVSSSVVDPGDFRPYGIGVAFPSRDFDRAQAEQLGFTVRRAAQRVGERIGDPYWLEFESD